MRIESIAVALPSRIVTNDDILNEIQARSRNTDGQINSTLRLVKRLLHTTGSETRRWLADGETSLDVTLQACRKAISEAQQPIDLLICASVYGELIEPATANYLAHKLGLRTVECFDLKEACDGWAKAVKVAHALIRTGLKRRILIVNGEFSLVPNFAIMPSLFSVSSERELEYRFPIFTLGEGATATILAASEEDTWRHTNKTDNDLCDLCTVTPTWYSGPPSPRIAKDGPGLFTSWASQLSEHGIPLAIDTFRKADIPPSNVDILFTHASSKKDWSEIAKAIGLANKIYDIYARYGNLVSASVPAAIALAHDEGVLKRGSRVAVLIASAGMSFSTVSFVF